MNVLTDIELDGGLQCFLDQELNKELLRFTTAGSVDDGKSTLIGRLLHDCKAVYEDQLASVKKSRINRSGRAIDFSLLTDGLRAEREQGITIDVAYRYFSTARRKFIIADTPGHEQYTRNMATGASTADLAIVLVDATKGLLPQTRRHAYIASLLGIPHVLAAMNKMDLVNYSEEVFRRLQDDFRVLAGQLGLSSVQCIPISALDGENVVRRGQQTAWYSGPTLLEHLETVVVRPAAEMNALRYPIQSVIRPDATFRGFAGRVAGGTLRRGDAVLALPSRQRSTVESIVTFDGDREHAGSSESVVVTLADEIDLSRGDMLVSPDSRPHVSSRFAAMIVWLHATPLDLNRTYLLKHAGRQIKARATRIRFRVDVNTLAEHSAAHVEMNGIASVEFETSHPLFFDPYEVNRTTGSFILMDPLTNATVGAGMIREDLAETETIDVRDRTTAEPPQAGFISLEERVRRNGHRPAIFSVTGTRVAAEKVERALLERGFQAVSVNLAEIPPAARRTLFSTLWNLGFVVVSWSETSGSSDERGLLGGIAGEFYFDFSGGEPSASADSIVRHALNTAEQLRYNGEKAEGKVNGDAQLT